MNKRTIDIRQRTMKIFGELDKLQGEMRSIILKIERTTKKADTKELVFVVEHMVKPKYEANLRELNYMLDYMAEELNNRK